MAQQAETDMHEEIQCNHNDQKVKNNNIIKIVSDILGYVVFSVLLLVAAAMLFVIFQNKGQGSFPTVLKHQIYIIRSNSMSPALDAGSIVIVKLADIDDIEENDIITFRRAGNSAPVTHRVVEAVHGGELQFITKGDANNTNDPLPVSAGEVIGRVTLALPLAGYALAFSGTRQGALTLLIIPGVLIFLMQFYKMFRYFHKRNNTQ